MQEDFHYYCVGVLARAAGFSSKDALTIAYASQYVDDSTESEPLNLKAENDLKFDPVRTAHYFVEAYNWSVQKRIYTKQDTNTSKKTENSREQNAYKKTVG